MMRRYISILATVGCILPTYASAYTQCTVQIQKIWSGDGGAIWLHYTNGGAVSIAASDPNKTSVLSMAMTALVEGRSMTVRYSADEADCTTLGRTDFLGAYLN